MEDFYALNGRTNLDTGAAAPRKITVLFVGVLLWLLSFPTPAWTKTSTNQPASLKISGFGFLGNREMTRLLHSFGVKGKLPRIIDRTFVEDAALFLFARVEEEGLLYATLQARFIMQDGSERQFAWTNTWEAT